MRSLSAGTTAAPTALASNGIGVIRSVAQREGEFRVKNTDTTRSGTNTALGGFQYDSDTGLLTPITEALVTAGTAGTALQSDGTYAEVDPLNTVWSIKTTRMATALTTRSYTTSQHVSLPLVLTYFNVTAYTDPNGFIVRGGLCVSTNLRDYSGVYAVATVEAWQKDAFTGLAPTDLRARGFSFSTPFGGATIPECLHGSITVSGTTGTDNPYFDLQTWSMTFDATSPATMPGSVVLVDTQQPYKGGYLRTTRTITPT